MDLEERYKTDPVRRYHMKLVKIPLRRRIRKALFELQRGFYRALKECAPREENVFVEIMPGDPLYENAPFGEIPVYMSEKVFPIRGIEDLDKVEQALMKE